MEQGNSSPHQTVRARDCKCLLEMLTTIKLGGIGRPWHIGVNLDDEVNWHLVCTVRSSIGAEVKPYKSVTSHACPAPLAQHMQIARGP